MMPVLEKIFRKGTGLKQNNTNVCWLEHCNLTLSFFPQKPQPFFFFPSIQGLALSTFWRKVSPGSRCSVDFVCWGKKGNLKLTPQSRQNWETCERKNCGRNEMEMEGWEVGAGRSPSLLSSVSSSDSWLIESVVRSAPPEDYWWSWWLTGKHSLQMRQRRQAWSSGAWMRFHNCTVATNLFLL